MLRSGFITAAFLALAFGSTFALKASDYFHICHRSDPDLENCIIQTINEMKPLILNGSKDLQLPAADPMVIKKVEVQQGKGSVRIDSTFTDLRVLGISKVVPKIVKTDFERGVLEITMEIPELRTEGDYEINGKILVLPISGKGDSWSRYIGVTGVMTIKMKPEVKSGVKYYKLEKLTFDTKVKKGIINMNNLFNGNKQLGDTMNKFMSDNWEIVFEELKPVIDTAIGGILGSIAGKVLSKFPADELFPQ